MDKQNAIVHRVNHRYKWISKMSLFIEWITDTNKNTDKSQQYFAEWKVSYTEYIVNNPKSKTIIVGNKWEQWLSLNDENGDWLGRSLRALFVMMLMFSILIEVWITQFLFLVLRLLYRGCVCVCIYNTKKKKKEA